jgi:hypothetical protein
LTVYVLIKSLIRLFDYRIQLSIGDNESYIRKIGKIGWDEIKSIEMDSATTFGTASDNSTYNGRTKYFSSIKCTELAAEKSAPMEKVNLTLNQLGWTKSGINGGVSSHNKERVLFKPYASRTIKGWWRSVKQNQKDKNRNRNIEF